MTNFIDTAVGNVAGELCVKYDEKFASEMVNCVSQLMIYALQMMNFTFKMMNAHRRPSGENKS